MQQLKTESLLSLTNTIAVSLFSNHEYPWEVLPFIKSYIQQKGPLLSLDLFTQVAEDVWIAKSAKVAQTASITGPCIIDEGAEIRHCAFIRGSVIVGKNAVVGNSVEVKNSVLFDKVQVPHFNYVGDSLLGYKAHMGGGAITSNVKSDKSLISVKTMDETIKTGLKKMGAVLGDNVEVGCNTVLNPGTVIGKNSNIYPTSSVRGYVPPNSIYKEAGNIVTKY